MVRAVQVLLTEAFALSALVASGSTSAAQDSGYWMLDAGGGVHAFGGAEHVGDRRGGAVVAIDATPSGRGYIVLHSNGAVWEYGDAHKLADPPPPPAGDRWTSITATASGRGFWIFSGRGCVHAVGDARHVGDMCRVPLNAPVVGSAITATGNGYWMVAQDGGVFSFGDAPFHGSTGGLALNQPVNGMAADPDGRGYWLAASDGGVFAFEAPFYGSMGGTRLNQPVVGIVASPTGGGYLMVARDGGIFTFGELPFHGSLGEDPPAAGVVSVTPLPAGGSVPSQQQPSPSDEPVDPEPVDYANIDHVTDNYRNGGLVDCGLRPGDDFSDWTELGAGYNVSLDGSGDDGVATGTWEILTAIDGPEWLPERTGTGRRDVRVLAVDLAQVDVWHDGGGPPPELGPRFDEVYVPVEQRPAGWVTCSYHSFWVDADQLAVGVPYRGESSEPGAFWHGTIDVYVEQGIPDTPAAPKRPEPPGGTTGIDHVGLHPIGTGIPAPSA